MRKNLVVLYSCLSIAFLFSCKKVANFLDKPPGVDIDENTIFSSRVQLDLFVATMYQFGLPSPLPLRTAEAGFTISGNNTNASGITDEAEASEGFSFTQGWNSGSINATNIIGNEDYRYAVRWQAIRIANIILERINEVPNMDATYREQVIGEALFIRAINNFEMFKRYGGFPLVLKRITDINDSKIPRSPLADCLAAIVKDCNDATAKLPVVQTANFTGRANKGAALAVKARALLYAASPLFNTATPYVDFGANNKLICFGNFDKNRWKDAADAALAVLTWAQDAGVGLIDVPAKRIPRFAAGGIVDGNYRTAWGTNDNAETILATKVFGGAKGISSFPWQHVVVRSDYIANAGGFWVATSPTFNFVRKYEDTLGNVVNWNPAGGTDLLSIYGRLDPRFCQTVVYTGARLHNNATRVPIYEGTLSNKATCKGGFWLLKWVPDAIGNTNQVPYIPLFRLNEFYLSYAEALNEFSGPGTAALSPLTPAQIPNYVATYNYPAIPASAYDLVNKVRLRSGMPPLAAGLGQADFREKLHNERDIELAFEDHRFNDIRRWMVAEQDGVMQGSFYGLEINKLNSATPFPTAFSYKPFVFEPRSWQRREYLFPYDNNEVLKGNLQQNPGW